MAWSARATITGRKRLARPLIGAVASVGALMLMTPPSCKDAATAAPGELVSRFLEFTGPTTSIYAGDRTQFSAVWRTLPDGEDRTLITYALLAGASGLAGAPCNGTTSSAYASISNTTAQDGSGIAVVTALVPMDVAQVTVGVCAHKSGKPAADDISTNLTINTRVQSVVISPPSYTLTAGFQTTFVTAMVYLAPGTASVPTPVVTWTSSNPSVASVNATTGEVKPLASSAGQSVTITGLSEGRTGTAQITVIANPTPADLQIVVTSVPATGTVNAGSTRQYAVTLRDNLGTLNPGFTNALRWDILPLGSTLASITPAGLATCSPTGAGGTVSVQATGPANAQGTLLLATAVLQCGPPTANAYTLSPQFATVTMAIGAPQQPNSITINPTLVAGVTVTATSDDPVNIKFTSNPASATTGNAVLVNVLPVLNGARAGTHVVTVSGSVTGATPPLANVTSTFNIVVTLPAGGTPTGIVLVPTGTFHLGIGPANSRTFTAYLVDAQGNRTLPEAGWAIGIGPTDFTNVAQVFGATNDATQRWQTAPAQGVNPGTTPLTASYYNTTTFAQKFTTTTTILVP